MCASVCAQLLQTCPTLCDPMDCSPPGSSICGILQARILEWVAIPQALHSPLYLRVLAVNKKRSDLFSALSQSGLPILARAHDEDCLTGVAKKVYEIDLFAEKIYTLPYENRKNKSIFI